MAYRKYTDAFRDEAMIQLALYKYDYAKTAKYLGNVTERTLRNWEKDYIKKPVPELLERTISRLLMQIPHQIPAKDYGIILGILLDKYLLLKGEPTSRAETVVRKLEGMTDDEWDDVQTEMERILAGEDSGGDGAGARTNHR